MEGLLSTGPTPSSFSCLSPRLCRDDNISLAKIYMSLETLDEKALQYGGLFMFSFLYLVCSWQEMPKGDCFCFTDDIIKTK